jgi:hypothetical protein
LTKEWVPLIDGPLVGWDSSMSGEPGQSMMTLVVRDDSVYLNTKAEARKFEGKTDDDIARELFDIDQLDQPSDVDRFPPPPNGQPLKIMQVCTQMELLLQLAAPYVRHVYVRPGAQVGDKSVGCLKEFFPKVKPSMPALLLAGPKRNIDSFHARYDTLSGATRIGAQLDIEKVATSSYASQWTDVELMGAENPFDQAIQPPQVQQLDPIIAAFYGLEEVEKAQQEAASFSIIGSGSVRSGCYSGVLTRYDVIAVSGVNEKLCTYWLIREVTHTLTRSEYRQDFTLITNSVAATDGNPLHTQSLF